MDIININGRIISNKSPTFIIAEIGLNHNGSLDLAKKLILKAKECGADAVKFQKRDLKALYKKDVYKDPNKDGQSTEYLMDIFKRFELTKSEFAKLKKFCDKLGIIFFCTPFDFNSVEFLEEIGVPFYKISSSDLTNLPLIKKIMKKKKPMFLSTGMSNALEIEITVKHLKKNKAKFALLHCVSTYPVAFKDVNLKIIPKLEKKYKVPIGYSGHERGITIAICAVTLGAKIIEKHFTLDRSMEGPDHNISLMPEGFAKMIDRIRMVEMAIGTGEKNMSRGEVLSREVFAKSLIAKVSIKKGEIILKDYIDVRSPGKGLSPQMIYRLIGKKATRNIKKHDYFTSVDINEKKI